MTKKRIERILTRKIKKIRKLWLKYVDALPEEGNGRLKEKGYLSIAVFKGSLWFNSSGECKDNVDCTIFFKEGK